MFCTHNSKCLVILVSQCDKKIRLTIAILTAGKGEEELYIRNSFPVWNKPAACEPVKHPKELFISAFTRGNACFISRGTSKTHNMKKSGFGSLLQAFVFIFIWKISGFSCVSTMLISCLNRSRLGMCCSEKFITGLCTKTYCCLQKIKPTTQPPNKQTLLHVSNVIWEIWAFWLWWEWFMRGNTAGFPSCSSGTS